MDKISFINNDSFYDWNYFLSTYFFGSWILSYHSITKYNGLFKQFSCRNSENSQNYWICACNFGQSEYICCLWTLSSQILALFLTRYLFNRFNHCKKNVFPQNAKKDYCEIGKESNRIKKNSQLGKQDHCIFANTIYRLEEAKTNHPAGYKIIQSVVHKSVDAFIYGIQPSEVFHQLSSHSHSFTSLKMLGSLVAKLDIKSVYTCFDDKDIFQATIQGVQMVSQKGNIYQFRLRGVGSQLSLRGYEQACQIGRFHSITAFKMTRLYTVVSFLSRVNLFLMEKIFGLIERNQDQIHSEQYYSPPSQEKCQTYIPLLLKIYPKGNFSKQIKEQSDKTYIISHEKGRGLGFSNLEGIKLCIITEGTGLFPFYGLIDLLFKQQYLKKKQQNKEQIIKISPILEKQQFKQAEIHLCCSIIHR